MTTRSNKSYINAAVKGNGAIPTPTAKSSGQGLAKVSLTPQQASGNLKSPGTQQQAAGNLKSPGTHQNQTTSSSKQPSNNATSPIGQMNLNSSVMNPPRQQQTSQTASVSRVNRGAPVRSFVATLGPSMGDRLIDYSSGDGQKTYKRAMSSLKDEYNGTAEGITVFRMQLEQKAINEGWANGAAGDCIHIPLNDHDPSSGNINIINERTRVSEQAIRVWAMHNLISQSVDPNAVTRKAQNNKNMAETIMNTLDKDCMATIGLRDEKYMIGGVVVAALLYKVLMEGAELETMVTSANIRAGLQRPEQKLADLDHNVKHFADHIRDSLRKLHARGETTNDKDLILSLFRALKTSHDSDFNEHFKKEHLLYLAGMKMYEVNTLLADAETMYAVKADNNDWGKLSKSEEELVAMRADFKDLNLRFSEERKKNKKLRSSAQQGPAGSHSYRRKLRIRPGEEWKFVNENNKKTCEQEGKTWYWCLNHNEGKGMWTIHKPSECKSKKQSRTPQDSEQAMPATVELDSGSEESEGSDF